jgi:hypothetical protein
VFAPSGEQHEIPLLAANYFFRKYKNRTTYFGVNISLDCLDYYFQHKTATHLYAHIITPLDSDGLNKYIGTLCKHFPDKKILLSGPACKLLEEIPASVKILHSLDEMIEFAKLAADPTLA